MNLNKLEKELKDFTSGSQEKIKTDDLWNRVQPHLNKRRRTSWKAIFFVGSFLVLIVFAGNWLNPFSNHVTIHGQDFNPISKQVDERFNTIIQNENNEINQGRVQAPSLVDNADNTNSENRQEKRSTNISNNSIEIAKADAERHNYSIKREAIDDNQNQSRSTVKNVIYENQFSSPNFNETIKTTGPSLEIDPTEEQLTQQQINELEKENAEVQAKLTGISEEVDAHQKTAQRNNNFNAKENTSSPINVIVNTQLSPSQLADNVEVSADDDKLNPSVENKTSPHQQDLSIGGVKELILNAEDKSIQITAIQKLSSLIDIERELPDHYPKRISPYVQNRFARLTFEFGGSYLMPNKTFVLQQSEFENEFASRQLAEEVLEGWYATANVRYHLTPKWGLSVGMHYGSINERSSKTLSYSETLFLQDTIVGNLVRVDGSIDPIYGDVEIDRTVIKNVSRINSYSFIQIPIELMYTQAVNRLNLEMGIGVVQSVRLSASGFWHPDESTEYDLEADTNGYLKSNLGLNLTGRLGVAYDITPRLGVYAHGRYIKYLRGLTNANYGIDQSYSLLGGELGFRIHLIN